MCTENRFLAVTGSGRHAPVVLEPQRLIEARIFRVFVEYLLYESVTYDICRDKSRHS